MGVDEESASVFEPWYAYLSTAELVFLAGMGVAAVATLWTGVTDPSANLGVSAGVALLFAGFVAFFVRWSVSEERSAALPAFDEEY